MDEFLCIRIGDKASLLIDLTVMKKWTIKIPAKYHSEICTAEVMTKEEVANITMMGESFQC